MTKLDLLKQLRQIQHTEDQYFDSLPSDISMAFVDNGYTQCLQEANALLVREVFGELAEWASYYLYEWKPGYQVIDEFGKTWPLLNDEEYYEFFQFMVDTN
jgi:hypothetical protein